MWKQKKKEREDWEKEILQSVLKGNWEALKKPKLTRQWTGKLLQDEQWKGNMTKRFEGIFAKDSVDKVAAELGQMWEEQLRRCKNKSWEPSDEEEIQQAMDKWKRGKATGPDRVSQEALMRLAQGGEGIMLCRVMTEELSDWLYRGKVTTEVSDSVTVLLPKVYEPGSWGDTRPITLSTTFLELVAQLLLGRANAELTDGLPWQFAGPGKRPSDLILIVRKLVRRSKEWKLPLHIVKLDVTEAFDSAKSGKCGQAVGSPFVAECGPKMSKVKPSRWN